MHIKQINKVDRNKQIVVMRDKGLTYNAIGLRLGISGERVRQILNGVAQKGLKSSELDPPLTTRDVSRRLNVHINTVRRWSQKGILKAYHIGPRGDRRFMKEDIDRIFTKRDLSSNM
jgi:excisionase family DNA binding protein